MVNKLKTILSRIRRLAYKSKILKQIVGKNNECSLHGNIQELRITIHGNNNTLIFPKKAKANKLTVYIRGNYNTIQIDELCYLAEAELWVEDNNCTLRIGKGTTIEQAHLAVTEDNSKLIIGEDCMLARNIEIRTGDSHAIYDIESNMRINTAKDVVIEDHVWVGSGAKILKGSILNAGCIIATGAIVTGEVPANTIASGIPAKIIKENIRWTRER